MAVGDLDVRFSTWNYFENSAAITSSPATAGAVYAPGPRGGSPRASLLNSVAPFLQGAYVGESGEDIAIDFAMLWGHNQVASAKCRFLLDDRDVAAVTTLRPAAIAARTNLTAGSGGVAGYGQDPADARAGIVFSGDTATSETSNTEVQLDFTVTENVARPLSGTQAVYVRFTLPSPPVTLPELEVGLWVGGSLVRTLYKADASGTAVEVVSGEFPASDVPGSSFQIRCKSTTTGARVAAASACVVVTERSGWGADSDWILFDDLSRQQKAIIDPRKLIHEISPTFETIGTVYLCVRFDDAAFPVLLNEVWAGARAGVAAPNVSGYVSLGDNSSVGRRADGSAQQTPAGGFIAPPGALWPITLRLSWALVDLESALDVLFTEIGGRGPNARLAVVATDASWLKITGIYATLSSVDLEPKRSQGAVKVDGLSLVMTT